jgi:hypothetical protein
MKILMIALISLFCFQIAQGQTANEPEKIEVTKYEQIETLPSEKLIEIPVDFCEDDLKKAIPESMKGLTILGVDLVYTTWRSNPEFDQDELNNNRYVKFTKVWPEAENDLVCWRYIGQTSPTSSEEASQLFHGFVIRYRPAPTKETIESEIAFMDEFLTEPMSEDESLTKPKEEIKAVEDSVILPIEIGLTKGKVATESDDKFMAYYNHDGDGKRLEETHLDGWTAADLSKTPCYTIHTMYRSTDEEGADFIIDSLQKTDNYLGSAYSWTKIRPKKSKKFKQFVISYAVKNDGCDTSVSEEFGTFTVLPMPAADWAAKGDYGLVEEVFNRHPNWMNSLVLLDVTGSMSPYLAQTMAWVRKTQDSEQVDAFVFFNDGDDQWDNMKVTGRVGGIYSASNTDFKSVYGTMKSTMRKGGGGDCPENNVEATIRGVKEFPDCNEVIMVADNWATPRDMSLVSQLNVPVHVIVCGSGNLVNVEYVQLAYDTGGSIHTMEEDMKARDIKPGSTFKLGKSYFTLKAGKIVRTKGGRIR